MLTTILFTWITCWGCGLGWISRARAGSNWPIEFAGYGQMLLVGSGLLTLGTVLVLLCRKNWLNWAAAGSATAGVTLAMLALYRVTAYASEHSFYSRLMEMPAATLYRLQLLPVLVPLFVSAFRRADELAIAMESRCYHGGEGRTRMKHLQMQGIDWAALIVGAAFLAGIIVLKKFGL